MSSIALVFLSALFIFWGVPILNATGRLRRFYLINKTMSINDARNACNYTNYTDLATIYDEEENTELVKMTVRGWIGAYHCRWSNGFPVTFIPDNKIGDSMIENCCGAINASGEWHCFNCNSTEMYFMCSKQDHNYSLIRENKTWFDAQQFCRKNHTDLVTIRNEEEHKRVKDAGNNTSFWIGLQYNHSFDWFDGGRSDYTRNSINKGCFTLLSQVYWIKYNTNCASALCYKSFIHVSDIEMSWEEAWDYCDSHYSGLLRIESENDQNETERLLKKENISGPVWVGLRQSRLFGFWIWTNGLHLGSWTNWKRGSEPEHQISHHCGAMEKEDSHYKWSDKDCRSKFRVLCELN